MIIDIILHPLDCFIDIHLFHLANILPKEKEKFSTFFAII
jgi:hypothetical protein